MPSGQTRTVESARAVDLAEPGRPAVADPPGRDASRVNGRSSSVTYDAGDAARDGALAERRAESVTVIDGARRPLALHAARA